MSNLDISHSIAQRIAIIRQQIPASIRLIAVTKQVSVEAMQAAYEAGIRDFGESKIQEAVVKQEKFKDFEDITWHLIGHLQSNKASKALAQFQWIHSLHSLKLARRLNKLAEQQSLKPKICLQVKLLPDPDKYGWSVSQLMLDFPQLNQYKHLDICGLMTIPPQGLTAEETLSMFQHARELADKIQQQFGLPLPHLSMGMSADYLLAVQAGATTIRLGRVLFGERSM